MITLTPMTRDDIDELETALTVFLAAITTKQSELTFNAKDMALEHLDHPDCISYWIETSFDRVGFALIETDGPTNWDLCEFSIFPQFRRRGLGRQAVHHLVTTHPGEWELAVVSEPRSSRKFWASCLADYPNLRKGPPFTEFQCHSYSFTSPEPEHD